MISYISGKILSKTASFLVIETGGLGYKVFVTPDSLENKIGEHVALHTYLKTSEDGMALFGLPSENALFFFEMLITVNGIGPKMALQILSTAKIELIKEAIASGNTDMFTRISGIGKKTAERIILELKNKVGLEVGINSNQHSDIYDALTSLGFSSKEINDILPKINNSIGKESQLKEALKLLRTQ